MAAVRWCLLMTVTLSWLTIAPLDAGPVSVNPAISPFGRNIRPIACKSKTGQVGTCMFAMDCTRMNGQHLGTCIDRFYFGSCCTASPSLADFPSISSTVGFNGNDIGSSSPSTLLTSTPPQATHSSSSEHPNALNDPSLTTTTIITSTPTTTTTSAVPVTTSASTTLAQLLSSSPATLSTLLTNPSVSTEAALATLLASSLPAVGTNTPVSSSTTIATTSTTSAPVTTTTTTASTSTTVTSTTPSPTTTLSSTTLSSTTLSSTTLSSTTLSSTTLSSTTPSSTTTSTTTPASTTNAQPSTTLHSVSNATDHPLTTNATATTTITTPVTANVTHTTVAIATTSSTSATTATHSPSTSSPPTPSVTLPAQLITTNGTTLGLDASMLEDVDDVTDSSLIDEGHSGSGLLPGVEDTTDQDDIIDDSVTTTESFTDLPSVSLEPVTPSESPLSTDDELLPTVDLSTVDVDSDTTTENSTDPTLQEEVSATSTSSPVPSVHSSTTDATTTTSTTSTVSTTSTTSASTVTTIPSVSSVAAESTTLEPTSTSLPDPSVQTELPAVDATIVSILNESTIGSVISGTELNGTVDGTTVQHQNYHEVCGRPQYQYPSARIVGGTTTHYGQWPWQVSLRQWRTATFLHKCGAALLNENWAITAAHCVDNVLPDDLLLRMGEYDLATDEEEYPYVERKVQIVASHPQFDSRTFEYDLALLRFYDPVRFQPNIVPICLPPPGEIDYVGRTAFVTGWGRLYEDGPLPSKMQQVSVPVINNTECENMYRRAGYVEHIPKIFICAGYSEGKRDSCEGDSGGPMVIREEQSWVLAGVISWGIGCAEANQPGVYTRISEFREWIDKIIVF